MKTTSYEISKKLEEAGFSRQPFWIWTSEQCCAPYQTNHDGFRSYDLETLLDALPDSITREYKSKEDGEIKEFKERLIIEKEEIRYSCDDIENADDANRYYQEYGYMQEFSIHNFKFDNESLADTAGKMWLMLKEKGLIC